MTRTHPTRPALAVITAALILTAGCGTTTAPASPLIAAAPTAAASGPAVRLPTATATASVSASASASASVSVSASASASASSPAPSPVATDPSPVTTPTPSASAPPTASAPRAQSPSTAATAPGRSAGAPPNEATIHAPTYNLVAINRHVAVQVAYAYLTLRLSYSWHDPIQGAGIRRAAAYASPGRAAAMTAHLTPTATTDWKTAQAHHVSAVLSVTDIQAFAPRQPAPGTWTLAVLTWDLHTAATHGATATAAGATTVTLQQTPGGTWVVTDDSFAAPN